MSGAENLRSRLVRYAVNVAPVFRATGAWVTHVSADLRSVTLRLPLKLKTRNPMGSMCGGNMYAAVHGIYAVMLSKSLGKDYSCVDRLSTIKFLKPARGPLFTRFEVTQGELDEVRALVARDGKTDRHYLVELRDAHDVVCCEVDCTVHIRKTQGN